MITQVFIKTLAIIDYIVVLTVLFGLLFGLFLRYQVRRDIQVVVAGAFALRVVYATVDDQFEFLAGRYDFVQFDTVLWSIAQKWQRGDVFALLNVSDVFYIPYGIVYGPVYTIFGHETVLVRLVTALFGALFAWNIYRIAAYLDTHQAGLISAGLSAIFPYWIYLSGLFYRDMFIMLLLSQTMYLLLCAVQTEDVVLWIGTSSFGLIVVSLRPENALVVGPTLVTALAVKLYADGSRQMLQGSIVTVIVSFGMLVWALLLIRRLRLAIRKPVAILSRVRGHLSREAGTAAYLSDVVYTNVFELLIYLPIGSVYFWFVPFPWQVSTLLGGVALLQNLLFWYPIVLLSLLGFWYLGRTRRAEALVLAVFILTGTLLYGAVEGNVGPALRHRSQFQFCFFIFAGIAVSRLFAFEASGRPRIVPRKTESSQNIPSDD